MSLLEPRLVQQLTRSRLRVTAARAGRSVGERPSGVAASGIEFADHRPYEPGDDLRHLDPHIYSRTGHYVVREFVSHRSLNVTVLVDASASMGIGHRPTKLRYAAQMAAVLSAVAVFGGDRVLVGAFRHADVEWHPALTSATGLSELFDWLEDLNPRGRTDISRLAVSLAPRLQPGGLLIVIGDWLTESAGRALNRWHHSDQELVALHIVAPEEVEPERLGSGSISMLDSETGARVDVVLDESAFTRYRTDFETWRNDLETEVTRRCGRYLLVRSDEDLTELVLTRWRTRGLIG